MLNLSRLSADKPNVKVNWFNGPWKLFILRFRLTKIKKKHMCIKWAQQLLNQLENLTSSWKKNLIKVDFFSKQKFRLYTSFMNLKKRIYWIYS